MARRSLIVLAFLLAVAAATLLGTMVQTQINLAALGALGLEVPWDVRLRTTGQDLAGFTRTMAPLVLVVLALALPVATWLARRGRRARTLLCALAAGLGFCVALWIVDPLVPMPTLIAATRGIPGTLAMAVCVALGGALFAAVTGPPARRTHSA